MKSCLPRLSLLLLTLALFWPHAQARELSELKLLYIGPRAADYVGFLKRKVARIENRLLSNFKPEEAAAFDVILLDWPQGEETREMRKLTSPLGRREDWTRPTVLLGSAGLNLAVAWKMKGGSGCTCMDPLAYDLRDHEIFERPFPIDRGRMISMPTPPDFSEEIKEPQIRVLPLVDELSRDWQAGWCTHTFDFAANPDVEVFSGGVNHQTPTSAGLWRQGNFLHFGFEQSPSEMNEQGDRLLLNAIAYISRFTEDRAIAITPSVFAGPVARSRGTPGHRLRHLEYSMDAVRELLAPELWARLPQKREEMAAWFAQNRSFLHPNAAQRLEVDEDLLALGLAFDKPEFFDRTLADLGSGDTALAGRARRLLERYVPEGPKDGAHASWTEWWRENQAYAFATDAGIYRWYVDPLAKKRGVPTSELRGPRRADL